MEEKQQVQEQSPKKQRVHDSQEQKLKKQIERDMQMVRGIFRCEEERGGEITFHFKKYKSIPLQRYTFVDGQSYEIPLMVAEHLAQNCWYPVHRYSVDKDGKPSQIIGRKVKRYDFVSSDFVTSDNSFHRLVTVEEVQK